MTSVQEHETNNIDLSIDDPELVKRMVDYLYTSDYAGLVEKGSIFNGDDPQSEVYGYSGTNYMLHARMYVLGDKFDIPKLRRHATFKLRTLLSQSRVGNFKHSDFINIMRFAFDSTSENDKELRPLILAEAKLHLSGLMRNQDFSGSFRKLLTEMPDLAWQILDRCI